MNIAQSFTYDATQGLHHFNPSEFLPRMGLIELKDTSRHLLLPAEGSQMRKDLETVRARGKMAQEDLRRLHGFNAGRNLNELWQRGLLSRSETKPYKYWVRDDSV